MYKPSFTHFCLECGAKFSIDDYGMTCPHCQSSNIFELMTVPDNSSISENKNLVGFVVNGMFYVITKDGAAMKSSQNLTVLNKNYDKFAKLSESNATRLISYLGGKYGDKIKLTKFMMR